MTQSLVLRVPATPAAGGGPRWHRHRAFAAAAGLASGSALLLSHHQRPAVISMQSRRLEPRRKPKLSWLVVDAASGAIGEIASLVVLYPLDSLKVLCQARGSSAATVLAELRALGCNVRAVRQLYAGCGSAALCSAAIGAIYLLAFYSAKRLGTAMAARSQQQQQQQQLLAHQQAAAAAAALGGRQQPASKQPGGSAGAAGSQLADGGAGHPPLSCEGTHPLVASAAGAVASLAGSVFEAPMEMFKLRTQAGALDGPMLSVMVREASTRGLGSLYATYGAFMLKSIPFDVAELATYSQLCDWRDAAAASGGSVSSGSQSPDWRRRLGAALAAVPSSASDMMIGAAAGAASVLVSMPCDTIKTRMDLHPPHCPPGTSGLLCNTRAFFDTGRQLMAKGGGPGALFVGVAPRLLQTVPSTMVYWAAVEGTRRLMRAHFDIDGPAPVAGSEAGGAALASGSPSPASSSAATAASSTAASSGAGSSRLGSTQEPAALPSVQPAASSLQSAIAPPAAAMPALA